ncbi:MAG: gephyrin-like molybdotransferase Glp [Pseudomonadota bacterium]
MVDWSGGNDTGPNPRKDAIWIAEAEARHPTQAQYQRNRLLAEETLATRIEAALSDRAPLLIGVDFPFGYPKGFARALTGADDVLSVWRWLADRIEDTPKQNNRWEVAGMINRSLGGGRGPFWGNGTKSDIPDLPRTKQGYANPFPDRRACETQAKGALTCWQLSGAGAVGSQTLTGLPVLERLRRRFPNKISVWPFEALDRPVAFVEIWPSLINAAVNAKCESLGSKAIKDEWQVRLMAEALAALPASDLHRMLDVHAPEEGWIFGLGHEAALLAALKPAPALSPPPLRNDCFAMPQGVDWVLVDDALSRLRLALVPVPDVESMRTAEAAGRVLAEDVHARRSNPPRANSAVDGYGFAAQTVGAGEQLLPLIAGRAAAGQPFDSVVPGGHAVRILTGAMIPDGVDAVVLEEDTATDGGRVAFHGPMKTGANTRRAGEDLEAGALVFGAGHRLRAPDLALLSAVGQGQVVVRRRLRVAVLSTGDEIVPAPDMPAKPHQIWDANRPMLLSLAESWGYHPIDLGHAPDDADEITARLDRGAAEADVILTSGGASMGDEDHVSALLRDRGSLTSWRIALKPGRPLALALWRGASVFGLPGNPVAALVCALVFARPALGVLAGGPWTQPQGFSVPAAFSKRKKPGRREYLRARLSGDGAAEVFASEGSGRISGLSWADGLVELPDREIEISPGTPVRYIPYASFGLT